MKFQKDNFLTTDVQTETVNPNPKRPENGVLQ